MFNNPTLLESLKNKHIFVTGGTGFFGKSLVSYLSDLQIKNPNFSVKLTLLTRNSENIKKSSHYKLFQKDWITFHQGDVVNFDFPKTKFDSIFHFATPADPKLNAEHPFDMLRIITEGMRQVMEFSRSQGSIDVLFTSSGAVYGQRNLEEDAISENSRSSVPCNEAISAYSEGKRTAELIGALYSKKYNIRFIIARCFSFTGPYLDLNSNFAIAQFFKAVTTNKDIILNSSGKSLRSFLYSDELIYWLLYLNQNGQSCSPYNIGSNEKISIHELALKIATFSQSENKSRVMILQKKEQSFSGDQTLYVPCIKKIETLLGHGVTIKLEEALSKTAHGLMF
jgi:nucleoside-diphosphate-sugar epimerase